MEPNRVLKALDGVIAQNLSLTAEVLRTSKDSVRRRLAKVLMNHYTQYSASSKPTWSLSAKMVPGNPNAFVHF